MTTVTFTCKDIECEACAGAISRSVGKLTGVEGVLVDVAKKAVQITYRESAIKEADLRKRLDEAGFAAT